MPRAHRFCRSLGVYVLLPLIIVNIAFAVESATPPFESSVPCRQITSPDRSHWFGYYDKDQFDAADRYVLGQAVEFDDRMPAATESVELGMVDTRNGDRWIPLGRTLAWCWQQGCMLQWVPGSDREVIWNTRNEREQRFESVVLDTKSGKKRVLPHPVYALSPDGRWAIYPDFRRLNDTRPGYGYAGLPDPNANVLEPKDAGLWRMDLATGRTELLLSFARIAALENPHEDMRGCKHWFNHLLYNTDRGHQSRRRAWRICRGATEPATETERPRVRRRRTRAGRRPRRLLLAF
ncbi:hypothetical protein HS125_20245 [bacterium]|nr:hypothetical protein [bacterium]